MNKNSYLYLAHCEKGSPSSKRLYGGIGWCTVQLCIVAATILSLVMTNELSTVIKDLLDIDLITSAALLGLSTIAGVFGDKTINASNKEVDDENIN